MSGSPDVRVAISVFLTSETPSPGVLARMVEDRGWDAVLFPDHTHIPVGAAVGHPGGVTELPDEYARVYDPLIASMAAAAATSRILVGTAVCLLNQRDPIVTAKAIASIDQLSAGRFVLGVGAGWNEGEMRNHGIDPAQRFRALRERVEAMTAIWTHDVAQYEGTTVAFTPMYSWPKPHQRPRPPILLGGNGPRAPQRAIDWADGWIPHTEIGGDDALLERIAGTRRRCSPSFQITLAMAPARTDRLERYRRAGVDRFLFQAPSASRDVIEARLDHVHDAVTALG